MTWHYSSSGSIIDQGGATDADQDMAWALLMADKQWARGAARTLARRPRLIGNIYSHEVRYQRIRAQAGRQLRWRPTRPTHRSFAPSYYRVFARVTSKPNWMQVLNTSYSILNKASGNLWTGPQLGQFVGRGRCRTR